VTEVPARDNKTNSDDARNAYDWNRLRVVADAAREHVSGQRTIRSVDIFSGCGGLTLGAKEACHSVGSSLDTVLAVDNDEEAARVFQANFPDAQFYRGDIGQLIGGFIGARPDDTESRVVKEFEGIDLLLAGPPCQGYSNLNNRTRQNDQRNHLYLLAARFAELVMPRWVIIENVSSVVHGEEGAVETTLECLAKLGYRIDAGVVNLAQLGVPQRRKRHVIVATLDSRVLELEAACERHSVSRPRTVRWAIEDLEDQEVTEFIDVPTRHSRKNVDRMQYLLTTGQYDLPNSMRPKCHQNGGHSYISMYGRLSYDMPAQTITSGFTSPGQGRYVHPGMARTLTPHEAARIQMFPDSFTFSSATTRTGLSSMIGNAAPMTLSYVLLLELLAFGSD
jgi:DNA (cytosine-5)-methyltransferase 1